jgi:hypothetical protein
VSKGGCPEGFGRDGWFDSHISPKTGEIWGTHSFSSRYLWSCLSRYMKSRGSDTGTDLFVRTFVRSGLEMEEGQTFDGASPRLSYPTYAGANVGHPERVGFEVGAGFEVGVDVIRRG